MSSAPQLSKAITANADGAHTRALLASNHAAAIQSREQKQIIEWTRETFRMLPLFGPALTGLNFVDENGFVAGYCSPDGHAWTFSNVPAEWFLLAAREAAQKGGAK